MQTSFERFANVVTTCLVASGVLLLLLNMWEGSSYNFLAIKTDNHRYAQQKAATLLSHTHDMRRAAVARYEGAQTWMSEVCVSTETRKHLCMQAMQNASRANEQIDAFDAQIAELLNKISTGGQDSATARPMR